MSRPGKAHWNTCWFWWWWYSSSWACYINSTPHLKITWPAILATTSRAFWKSVICQESRAIARSRASVSTTAKSSSPLLVGAGAGADLLRPRLHRLNQARPAHQRAVEKRVRVNHLHLPRRARRRRADLAPRALHQEAVGECWEEIPVVKSRRRLAR